MSVINEVWRRKEIIRSQVRVWRGRGSLRERGKDGVREGPSETGKFGARSSYPGAVGVTHRFSPTPRVTHVCYKRYILLFIIIIIIIIIISIVIEEAALKGNISLGVRRRGKTGKNGKIGVKRKWWVIAQPPYSSQGNGRQSPGWNQGDRTPDTEENPGSHYRQKMGVQARPRAHSRYIHVKNNTRAGPLTPNN